jgi:hypothetical protein
MLSFLLETADGVGISSGSRIAYLRTLKTPEMSGFSLKNLRTDISDELENRGLIEPRIQDASGCGSSNSG